MRLRVPATSANLGPGFDTLGMALHFFNYFEAKPADSLSVEVSPNTCIDIGDLSLNPKENLLAQAYTYYFTKRQEAVIPATLTLEAHIPLARGMGSSSTAIVAGLCLANAMHPQPWERSQLTALASELEGHPDNVVPALLGDIHCCLDNTRSLRYRWPEAWQITLVIPPTPLSTKKARAVMPPHYPVGDVITNIRGMAAWIDAIQKADPGLFRYALASDTIHEPARGQLIPEYEPIQRIATEQDSLGCIISGAGSTLAVFTDSVDRQKAVITTLKQDPQLTGCKVVPVKPDSEGACFVQSAALTSGTTP